MSNTVWVISRKKLLEASQTYPDATSALDTWYRIAKKAKWESLADIKRSTWAHTDQYGTCTIFDIRGNNYRLIAWINYGSQKIFIKHVLTHKEYDKEEWKNECTSD